MVGELTVLAGIEDLITAEADGEMEHEESKEKEKEKTTSGYESLLLANNSMINPTSKSLYTNRFWSTPFIDFQTPPPKLA